MPGSVFVNEDDVAGDDGEGNLARAEGDADAHEEVVREQAENVKRVALLMKGMSVAQARSQVLAAEASTDVLRSTGVRGICVVSSVPVAPPHRTPPASVSR